MKDYSPWRIPTIYELNALAEVHDCGKYLAGKYIWSSQQNGRYVDSYYLMYFNAYKTAEYSRDRSEYMWNKHQGMFIRTHYKNNKLEFSLLTKELNYSKLVELLTFINSNSIPLKIMRSIKVKELCSHCQFLFEENYTRLGELNPRHSVLTS